MAHHEEPMDVDSEFDNKENTYHHTNVLPCTEKGYEELDVSELNMKLRYSITPAASPMSKSYTAYVDNRNLDEDSLNCTNENSTLTRSLNSTMTKNDSVIKTLKPLPLQTISKEPVLDNRGSVLRQLDSTVTGDNIVTITLSEVSDMNENLSMPSSSSSAATTPTNIMKNEEGSPIIRGLKSVFNMFRSSQSPIPPIEGDNTVKEDVPPLDEIYCEDQKSTLSSTPVSAHRSREGSSKRGSPLKDSIVFNDDLEKELQWKDETILFSEEKIPIHKLFLTSPALARDNKQDNNLNSSVEYMDISQNISVMEHTLTEIPVESDGEFVDCETTFSKSDTQNLVIKEETPKDPLLDATKVLDDTKIEENLEETKTEKYFIDNPRTLEVTREIEAIKHSNNDEEIEGNHNLPSINSVIQDVTQALVENVVTDNEILNVNNEIIEHASSANVIQEVIQEDVSTIRHKNIDIVKEPLIDTFELSDATKNIQDENIPSTTCELLESSTIPTVDVVLVTNSCPTKELKDISLAQNVDDAKLNAVHMEDKNIHKEEIQENEITECPSKLDETAPVDLEQTKQEKNMNITQLIENEQTFCKEIEESQNECLPVIEVSEKLENITLGNISSSLNVNDKVLEEPEKLKESFDETGEQLPIEQKLVPCLPNENVPVTTSIHCVDNFEQKKSSIDCITMTKETSDIDSLSHEEDAVNIPLPDNDGFDLDFEPNKLDMTQVVPSDVVETVKAESKLDDTVVFNQVVEDKNSCENAIVEEKVLATLCDVQNALNDTHDIVNSLTEIIGESQNNTIILTEDALNQPQKSVMEGIECADETHVLPDLVNQTLHNMSVDGEIISESITPIHSDNIGTKSERNLNITEENKNVSSVLDTPLSIITTEQCIETINVNKRHTNTNVTSESIAVEPKINLIDSKLEYAGDIEIEKNDVILNADTNDVPTVDEELVVSENNSPYVSVIAETEAKTSEESFEEIEIPHTFNDAPSSPPIKSRGYNFNFDEMDDPFATKSKIRLSPPPVANKEMKAAPNRRRSQPPERKRPALNKKKFNTIFDAASVTDFPKKLTNSQFSQGDAKNISDDLKNTTVIDHTDVDTEVATILESTQVLHTMIEENIAGIDNVLSNAEIEEIIPATNITSEISAGNKSSVESISTEISEVKTSSSEQSTYYSAAASSSDSSNLKNIFNLPEIDDKNFNPFATKSRMRQSPTLDVSNENLFATKSKMKSSPDSSIVISQNTVDSQLITQNETKDMKDKMETEPMEKECSYLSNTTSASKEADDKNIKTQEVNTEDEDTEEGPFLEAEDAIDKLLDIENEEMMQFNEIPAQRAEDNADGGELFIDAEAFEFLLNQNKSNVVADSGKESLFLKFDPLFAKRISSEGVLAALNKLQKRQSTPTKPTRPSLRNEASPIAGPSTIHATYEEETNASQDSMDDLNITVAKPMMVVTPAVNAAVTPRNKTTTPPRSNRRSITFTSPAMAVIDRLLSLSGNNYLLGQDSTITQSNRDHNETDLALTQLRELLAEKEISVYQLRNESKELKDRLSTMESQVKILEAAGKERLDNINDLNARLAEKTKFNKSMAAVVEEYERTIASLIAETEQDKKRHAEERIILINERDEQTAHLASMEVSFSDLHSKYEKSKQVILSFKANEEACKKSIKEFEENITKMQTNYEMLKQHATSKLNHANLELQKINKAHESEVLKLNALIKRKDMHITSLEETLARKTKANEELTAICDELINKVG